MIKKWLSAYRFSYIRSLVYMLQASEYNIENYLRWYGNIKNFYQVEQRKNLIFSPKALFLFVISWLFVVFLLVFSLWLVGKGVLGILLSILILISLPYILAHGILIPLFFTKYALQRPIEWWIVSLAARKLNSHSGLKIVIAGSYGKTTMREILKTVLAEKKKVGAVPHSYNTPLGISKFIRSLDGDEDVLIFELGEYYPGDIHKLCQLVHPDIGIITGVNEAHLEKFKTLEMTVGTIFELADYLGKKPLYINAESDLAASKAVGGNVLYSKSGVGDWGVTNCKTSLDGTSFDLIISDSKKISLKSHLLGLHQVGPLAAAVYIAHYLDFSNEELIRGVEKTKPFDHRLEPKKESNGVVFIDDSYNGNPDGVKVAIDFLTSIDGRRRFYVTPGLVEMGNMTEIVHKKIGYMLAKAQIEKVVLVKNSVTPFIADGLINNGYQGEIIWFDDALVALSSLSLLTIEGDVVLLQNDWPDQYQ